MADINIENLIALNKAKLVPGQRVIKIGQDIFLPIGIGGKNPPGKEKEKGYFENNEEMVKEAPSLSFFSGVVSNENDAEIEMKVEPFQSQMEFSKVPEQRMLDLSDINAKYLVLRGCLNQEINGDYYPWIKSS